MTTETQRLPLSLWLTIWFSPRRTVRHIIDTDSGRHVVILAILVGVNQTIERASMQAVGDNVPMWAIPIAVLVLGPLGGLVLLYLGSFMIRWTGKWLGGQATYASVRAALAWASIPLVGQLLLWIPKMALFGQELFTMATPRIDASPVLALAILGFAAIEVILAIWSIVLTLKCVGEAHQFSIWKGLASVVLAGLILFVPILCIAGTFLISVAISAQL